jgi:DNA polymerase III subunit delta
MSLISHQSADKYLSGPPSDAFIYLFFGADQGVVFERRQALLHAVSQSLNGKPEILHLQGDAIAANPFVLIDEANAINMFGGDLRVIQIALGARNILPALGSLAKAPPANCLILIEDGELKRDSALRKWFEAAPSAVAIECQPDDPRDIQRLIDSRLRSSNQSIDPDAREAFGAMLGEDRLTTRAEIEKLCLYTIGQDRISIEHVRDISHDASIFGIESLLSALFSGDTEETILSFNRLLQLSIDTNMILLTTLRHCLAFHKSRSEIDSGASFDQALQNLLRAIYGYNKKGLLTSQLKILTHDVLDLMICDLNNVISYNRKNSRFENEMIFTYLHKWTRLIRIKSPH